MEELRHGSQGRQESNMKKREQSNSTEGKGLERLVALSDGLFATVLTLLVLDLRLPDAISNQGANVIDVVRWLGPHLFSYLLTFLVAGVYWMSHHRNFSHITGSDRILLGYNLLFLLFIGLLPFSTAMIGVTAGPSASAYPFYWAIYCANLILAGLLSALCWLYALSHGFVGSSLTRLQSRGIVARQLVTPAVFLLSAILEFLFPRYFLGPVSMWLIPVVQRFVDRAYADAEAAADHPGWTDRLWRAGSAAIWLVIIGLSIWAMTF
jgi:uncharacterized membrane protein